MHLLQISHDQQDWVLTHSGGMIEKERLLKHWNISRLSEVSSRKLWIPVSLIERYLPDMPDVNERLPDGRYRFLDREIILPERGEIRIRNIHADILEMGEMRSVLKYEASRVHKSAKALAKPTAVFPGGMVGSGKTSLVVKDACDNFGKNSAVMLDRDETRKRFFLYHMLVHPWVQAHDFDYRDIHSAISFFNAQQIDALVAQKIRSGRAPNVIKDGTLSHSEDNLPLLKELSGAGYITELPIVLVPIEEGKKRGEQRFLTTGRRVPSDVVDDIGTGVMTHLVDYIASPYVTTLDIIDNSGKKGETILIARASFMSDSRFKQHISGSIPCEGCAMIKVGERISGGKIEHKLFVLYEKERLRLAFDDAIEHGGKVPGDVILAAEDTRYLSHSFNGFDLSVLLYRLLR